jgi:hypothetical protein
MAIFGYRNHFKSLSGIDAIRRFTIIFLLDLHCDYTKWLHVNTASLLFCPAIKLRSVDTLNQTTTAPVSERELATGI